MKAKQANGTAKGLTMNGQPTPGGGSSYAHKRARRREKRGYLGWAFDKTLKIAVWYSIVTLIFRCPASSKEVTADTPAICKPSLQTKEFAWPYVEPYYEEYLGPYVQRAEPYVDLWKRRVYQPSQTAYRLYGAPRVADAQKFGQQQWEKQIKPQLEVTKNALVNQYDTALGPHVNKIKGSVEPYYNQATTSAKDIWELELQPVYRKASPYLHQIYDQGQSFALTTALPHAQHAGAVSWSFVTRHIWPRIRILYGENVEPQLNRITERLGRYRDGKKLEGEIANLEAELVASTSASLVDSNDTPIASMISETVSNVVSGTPEPTFEAEPEQTISLADRFNADLKSWETVCAVAADEGAEHLRGRVQDICDHQISSQARGVGDALVVELEETAAQAVDDVKASIRSVVASLPEDDEEGVLAAADEEIVKAVRTSGQSLRARAQALRTWHQAYNAEIDALVRKALESTLETIDSIRELRLSEIGRRYASADLPHKEWSKYNDVKKATQNWRNGVESVALEHSAIAVAREAGEEVQTRGMEATEETVKELARLKQVAKWKITARDSTKDFRSKIIPAQAERARQQVADAVRDIKEAIIGTEQGTVESITSDISEKAQSFTSSAAASIESLSAQYIADESINFSESAAQAASYAQSVAAEASEAVFGKEAVRSVKSVGSKISETILGSETPAIESIASQAIKSAKFASDVVSEAIVGRETPKTESIISNISKGANSAASAVSEAVIGTEQPLVDSVTSEIKENFATVATAASEVIIGTPSGLSDTLTDGASKISAAIMGSEKPITETIASSVASNIKAASSDASEIYSGASKSVKVAASAASSAISVGSDAASSIADNAKSSVSSAISTASSAASSASKKVFAGAYAQVILEAREPILDDLVDDSASYSERIQSMVNDAQGQASQLTQAIADAISKATATQGTVESLTSLASEQYERAMSAASSVLLGTEAPAVERGASALSEQYSKAVSAASQAIYGTPTPYISTAISSAGSVVTNYASAASSRLSSALREASEQYESALSAASAKLVGTPEPAHKQLFSSAESIYSAATAAASKNFDAAIAAVPTAMPSQNAYESISSIASSQLASALEVASAKYQEAKVAVGVEPAPNHQQYLASAQSAYYQGIGIAHDRYSSFISAASSAVGLTPTAGFEGYVATASVQINSILSAASATVTGNVQIPAQSYLDQLSSQYDAAVSAVSSQMSAASQQASEAVYGSSTGVVESAGSAASEAIYGTQTPTYEAMASRAVENWDALISQASVKVYGAPPPLTEAIASQAGLYASQVTDVAAKQYEAVQAIFSDLIIGREPDFTESIMSRLQSVYSTAAPAAASSASSYASVAYASASSYVDSVFTPPASLENLLEDITAQLNAAIDVVSAQALPTEKGTIEQATEAAASVYSEAASQVSEAVYGRQTGYVEAAQSSLSDIAAAASKSLSEAIYGTSTGLPQAAQESAASVYSSLTSAAVAQASAASSAVSVAIYGEEKSYIESMQAQIAVALASAQSKLEEFAAQASEGAAVPLSQASEFAKTAASSVSSVVSAASSRVKDEL